MLLWNYEAHVDGKKASVLVSYMLAIARSVISRSERVLPEKEGRGGIIAGFWR